jgi:hypothetical protein
MLKAENRYAGAVRQLSATLELQHKLSARKRHALIEWHRHIKLSLVVCLHFRGVKVV